MRGACFPFDYESNHAVNAALNFAFDRMRRMTKDLGHMGSGLLPWRIQGSRFDFAGDAQLVRSVPGTYGSWPRMYLRNPWFLLPLRDLRFPGIDACCGHKKKQAKSRVVCTLSSRLAY